MYYHAQYDYIIPVTLCYVTHEHFEVRSNRNIPPKTMVIEIIKMLFASLDFVNSDNL